MAKQLREGFTTGTAAAAAAKAAVIGLLTGKMPERVSIALPPFVFENGVLRQDGEERLTVALFAGARDPDGQAWAEVVKDGGDDPDATHGAILRVRAAFAPFGAEANTSLSLPGGVTLHTGTGVGVATLPGLPVAVGEPAVNPQPRKQIAFAVAEAAAPGQGCGQTCGQACGQSRERHGLHLLLEVPDGTLRARRTLNPRLGIQGGISILGNSGTVRPYSHDAWKATISQGVAVASALGITELVLSTGRRSERLGFGLFPHLPPQAGIQAADHAAHSLREAARESFHALHWVCFPGKLLKLAQGLEWTHARSGEADINLLAALTREQGGTEQTAGQVAAMPTAAGAFSVLGHDAALHDAVLRRLGDMAFAGLSGWLQEACAANSTPVPALSLHVFALDQNERGRNETDSPAQGGVRPL